MQSASHLVANLFEDSGKRLRAAAEKVAADSAVRKATIANHAQSRAAAQKALARIATTGQQILGIDLRDKTGRQLAWADGNAPKTSAFLKTRPNLPAPPKTTTISQILSQDSVIFYALKSAVVAAPGDTTGFVTVYKQISAANGAKVVASLIGGDASVLIGNSDGKVWTDMSTMVVGPPAPEKVGAPTAYTSSTGDRRIGTAVPI